MLCRSSPLPDPGRLTGEAVDLIVVEEHGRRGDLPELGCEAVLGLVPGCPPLVKVSLDLPGDDFGLRPVRPSLFLEDLANAEDPLQSEPGALQRSPPDVSASEMVWSISRVSSIRVRSEVAWPRKASIAGIKSTALSSRALAPGR